MSVEGNRRFGSEYKQRPGWVENEIVVRRIFLNVQDIRHFEILPAIDSGQRLIESNILMAPAELKFLQPVQSTTLSLITDRLESNIRESV